MAAQVFTNYGEIQVNHNLFVMKVYCKCDTGKATWDDTVIPKRIQGEVICVDTVPGETNPQDNYDLYLKNAQGIDVMGGGINNRSTDTNQRGWPIATIGQSTFLTTTPVDECLTVTMSGNNVNGADWYMYVYYKKAVDEGLG